MKNNNSLKIKLVLSFIISALLPLIIVNFIISYFVTNSIIKDNCTKNEVLINTIKKEIEDFLDISIVEILQIERIINKKIISTNNIKDLLNSFIEEKKNFKSIIITDKKGIIKYIAPYNESLINNEYNIQELKYFIKKNIYLTDARLSLTDYYPSITLGYISDYIYLGEIKTKVLNNFIDKIKVGGNTYSFIVDRTNRFIAHTNKENVKYLNFLEYKIINKKCNSRYIGCFVKIENKKYLLNIKSIDGTGWKIGTIQPQEEVYESIFKSGIIITIGIILSLILSIIFSLSRTKKILIPLEIMVANSKKISEGNYDIKIINDSFVEIVDLSNNFQKMISIIKEREDKLKANEKNIKEIFNNLPIAMAIFDKEGKIIFFNIMFKKIFGYHNENISLDEWLYIFYSHDTYKEQILKLILERMKNNTSYNFETKKIKTLDNEEKIIDMGIYYYNENIILNFIDTTEKYNLIEKINASLREKDLYLKEIHHRVKNNLQIINSLLNLQKRKLQDQKLIEIFTEIQNRILSMSSVHEELYRSRNFGKINLKNLILNIFNNISKSYQLNKNILDNKILEDDILVDIDTGIPIGLIISEILSNSFKYAFRERNDGVINIELYRNNNKILLTISDNGCGLPKDFNIEETDSFGISLIYNLTKQISGTLNVINQNGLKYIIEI